MNIINEPTLTASVVIGLQIGYSDQVLSKSGIIQLLQECQQEQISERNVYLSACVSECEIILNGQIEPHLKLDFINYPKFPLAEIQFKQEVDFLTLFLMNKLNQNRVVITYHNETKMFEKDEKIDPRIKNIV